jgi:hypothetical protein
VELDDAGTPYRESVHISKDGWAEPWLFFALGDDGDTVPTSRIGLDAKVPVWASVFRQLRAGASLGYVTRTDPQHGGVQLGQVDASLAADFGFCRFCASAVRGYYVRPRGGMGLSVDLTDGTAGTHGFGQLELGREWSGITFGALSMLDRTLTGHGSKRWMLAFGASVAVTGLSSW